MKFALVLLFVAVCSARSLRLSDAGNAEALNFTTGFLESIGETGESFNAVVRPCGEGLNVLSKLASEVAKANVHKVAQKIQSQAQQFVQQVNQSMQAFNSSNYKTAGQSVGSLFKFMFLASLVLPSPADGLETSGSEYLKGFLAGIKERGDVNTVAKCLKDMTSVFNKTKESLNLLRYISFTNLDTGLRLLFDGTRELMTMIKPCSEGYKIIGKLVTALASADIREIILKVMGHPTEFLHDVMNSVGCFKSNKYQCAGKTIGDMLSFMLL